MKRVHSYLGLAAAGLGLTACISSPEQPAPGDSLLALQGSLELQGSPLEGALGAALAFTTDTGNELRVVSAPTLGAFPTRFSMAITEAPPTDILYALREDEPTLAFGYITATGAPLPASVRLTNFSSGSSGCTDGACTEVNTWCSGGEDPADDLCYTETETCDLNHQNCALTTSGDVALKSAPWSTLAGISTNYLVLYLSSAATAGSLTSLAFAEGQALSAGYHLLAVSARSEAELEAANACGERSEQLALDRYNKNHGTQLESPIDLPSNGEDEFDALYFDAQVELRCPQTEKRYSPVANPNAQPITIQLARTDESLAI